jgi:hypothetical protein
VDFEIEFSKEELSKIKETDVDVATLKEKNDQKSIQPPEFSDNNYLFIIF